MGLREIRGSPYSNSLLTLNGIWINVLVSTLRINAARFTKIGIRTCIHQWRTKRYAKAGLALDLASISTNSLSRILIWLDNLTRSISLIKANSSNILVHPTLFLEVKTLRPLSLTNRSDANPFFQESCESTHPKQNKEYSIQDTARDTVVHSPSVFVVVRNHLKLLQSKLLRILRNNPYILLLLLIIS